MLIKISQSWEDVLIGYDTDNCHHPNACDPLPCCAEKRSEVYCCPTKDGVCCDDGCCPADAPVCCGSIAPGHCCPSNTVCHPDGCYGIDVRIIVNTIF